MIQYLFSGSDQAAGLFNSPVDDQTGDWWAGSFMCGALIANASQNAIASTLVAARKVGNEHTDFAPPQPSIQLIGPLHQIVGMQQDQWGLQVGVVWGEGGYVFSLSQSGDQSDGFRALVDFWNYKLIAPWSFDQGGLLTESFKLEESYDGFGYPRVPKSDFTQFIPNPWWDGSDQQSLTAITRIEEEYWPLVMRPFPIWWTPPIQPFVDDGSQDPALGNRALEDGSDISLLLNVALGAYREYTVIFQGDFDQNEIIDLSVVPSIAHEDSWHTPLSPKHWWIEPIRPFMDSGMDLGNLHLNPSIDDVISQPVWPKPEWWTWTRGTSFGDPTDFVTFVAAPVIDEDFWPLFGVKQDWWTLPLKPFVDTSDSAVQLRIVIDESYWWKHPLQPEWPSFNAGILSKWIWDHTIMGTGIPVSIPGLPGDPNAIFRLLDTSPRFKNLSFDPTFRVLR